MPKTLRKLLYCSMALMEVSPVLFHTLTASAQRTRTTGYSALPKHLRDNLDDYYGHNVAIRIYNTGIARNRAEDFENLWKNFNNNPKVQHRYGHVSKAAYATRLRNERYIDSGITNGKDNDNNIQFYGWLQKSLSDAQKNAVRHSEPVTGLTKTQRRLLSKYGVTNQLFARENFDNINGNKFSKIQFPFEANLTSQQKSAIRNNQTLRHFSKKTRNILSHFGIPVENGENIETSYNDYMNTLMRKNAKANGYKGPNEADQTDTNSPSIDQDIDNWSKAAKKGVSLPKIAYGVAVNPQKHLVFPFRFPTTDVNDDKTMLHYMREAGFTQIKLTKRATSDTSKDNGHNKDNGRGNDNSKDVAKLAQKDIPSVKVFPKDSKGRDYYDTIIDNKPVRFTKIGSNWSLSTIKGAHMKGVPASDKSNPSTNITSSDNPASDSSSDSNGSDGSDNYGAPYSDSSDDTGSDQGSDESNKNQSDNGNGFDEDGNTGTYGSDSDQLPKISNGKYSDGSAVLNSDSDSDQSSDSNNHVVGVPNIWEANQVAIAKAKNKIKSERDHDKSVRDQALQQAKADQHKSSDSSKEQRDVVLAKARQAGAAANVANHNLNTLNKNHKTVEDILNEARSNEHTDSDDRKQDDAQVNSATTTVNQTVKGALDVTPTMSRKERRQAAAYFKRYPDMLNHPNRVKNRATRLFLKYAALSPAKATYVGDPQASAAKYSKKTKHNKKAPGKSYTNNANTAAQIKEVHELYSKISQLEAQIHKTHHKTARVKSVENLPYDGYSKTLQAYGNYLIANKPNDTPNAKPVVTTDQIKRINHNSGNINKFWMATQKATTTDGNTYYHVISMNGNVSGWINAKGLLTVKISKTKIPMGGFPVMRDVKKAPKGINPAFVDAYENMLQRYMMGDKKVQKIARHKFNKNQVPLDHMYSDKDLKGKDKALDNIAKRFQDFIQLKMQIPQYSGQALKLSKMTTK